MVRRSASGLIASFSLMSVLMLAVVGVVAASAFAAGDCEALVSGFIRTGEDASRSLGLLGNIRPVLAWRGGTVLLGGVVLPRLADRRVYGSIVGHARLWWVSIALVFCSCLQASRRSVSSQTACKLCM